MKTETRTAIDTSRLAHLYARRAPLLRWTGHEIDRAHLDIEPDGTVTAGTTARSDNGLPESVYYDVVQRISIPAEIKGGALEALIGRISPLLERLVAGMGAETDGNGNRRGTLPEDAMAARGEIEAEIERLDEGDAVAYWEVGDWLRDSRDELLEALRGGEAPEAMRDRLVEEAEAQDVVLSARELSNYIDALAAEVEAE